MRKLFLALALLWGFPALSQGLPSDSQSLACIGRATAPAIGENMWGRVTCDLAGNLRTTGGGGSSGGGGATGSVTPAGTSGSQAQAVQGIDGGVPQNVQASSLPLPNGAATAAKQPALGTAGSPSADVLTVQGTSGGFPQTITGSVASGGADSGNPVKGGFVYRATPSAFTDGQRTDALGGLYGQGMTSIYDSASTNPARVLTHNTDNTSINTYGLLVTARTSLLNGTSMERAYTALGAARGAGVGIAASNPVPTTGDVGITQAFNNGANSLSAKTSAGNLYAFGATLGGTAGFIAIVNAAATPAANATIAPIECIPVQASQGYRSIQQVIPYRYSAGIQILATTSCTTFAAPTNAAVNLNAAVQ